MFCHLGESEGGLGGLENRAGSRSFTVIRTLFAAIRTLFAHYSHIIRSLFAIIRDYSRLFARRRANARRLFALIRTDSHRLTPVRTCE